MLQVNLTDETNFAELMKLLLSGEKYKLVLTKDDKPVAKITLEEKPKRYFGMFKDEIQLAPDFDEWFDAMDAEILADFSDDPDCEF